MDTVSETPRSLHPMTTLKRDVGNCHRLSIRNFPSGDVEIMAIKHEPDQRLGVKGKKPRKNIEKKYMDLSTINKSRSRAKKKVRHKSMTMQADRMLTLTFQFNLTDIGMAWDVLNYFNKLMRHEFGKDYCYIAVPEYQKRGAVHFHLALHGYYHVKVVRKLWLRAAGKFGGNVDITSPKKYGKNSWNPRRIARYLSKYITKSDSVSFNKKRYSSTRTLIPPEPLIEWLPFTINGAGNVIGVMSDILEYLTEQKPSTMWEINGYLSIKFLST